MIHLTIIEKMRFILPAILFLSFSSIDYGQSISPKIVSTSGNSISNSSYNLSYNIGEVATETINNNNYMISQGFLQPANQDNFIKLVSDNFTLTAYPNPVSKLLNLDIKTTRNYIFYAEIIDILGNVKIKKKIATDHSIIDFENYPPGIYFIRISSGNNEIYKKIKIVKQ